MTNFDPQAPLNRIDGESVKANSALMDYWVMGAGRSLQKLIDRYIHEATSTPPIKPPTTKYNTITTWSLKNHWQARIKAQKEIDDEKALDEYRNRHMSPAELVARLSDMGRADIADFADVRSPADLEGKLNTHVIRRITVNARRHKDGTITAKTTIEMHDSQAALEKLARHLGLFKDRLDITTGDQPFTIDDLNRAAQELDEWQKRDDTDSNETEDTTD